MQELLGALRDNYSRSPMDQVLEAARGLHKRLFSGAKESAPSISSEPSTLLTEEGSRLLIESIRDYAIYMLDIAGNIVSWNPGAEQIIGYKADEILGQNFSCLFPPEDLANDQPEQLLEIARKDGRVEAEGLRARKDGRLFWAHVIINALHDSRGQVLGFSAVTRDLTESKRIEKLEEGRRQMHQFLAMLAHELRNPLAPIRNAVGLMRASAMNDPDLEWARDVIDRQVSHLTHLVDDLLDVNRITTGKITVEKKPINMADIVSRAVESAHPLIETRRHTLEVALSDKPLYVRGDLTRLSQVVLNLLDNSVKYTPKGGKIYLSLGKEADKAVLRVRDTGVGIASNFLPKVFDPFMQADHSLARSQGGLGIGLTVVHRLVSLHDGTIEVVSDGPGRGSEFVIRLPLIGASPSHVPAPIQACDGSVCRRILVVDDHHDSVRLTELLLRAWGHQVAVAHSGMVALSRADEYRPEIILLDIGLPGMDGYAVAKQLRTMPGLQNLIIVAITGYGQTEDRQRSQKAGFNYHLVKPVDPAALKNLIAVLPISQPDPLNEATYSVAAGSPCSGSEELGA